MTRKSVEQQAYYQAWRAAEDAARRVRRAKEALLLLALVSRPRDISELSLKAARQLDDLLDGIADVVRAFSEEAEKRP